MRSHAKASSAGSTQGQGSRPGSFVRGADGISAPSRRLRLVATFLSAALIALALFASSAFAAKELISDFGTVVFTDFGAFAGSGSFGGELSNPRDVAVNETGVGPANEGDVFVADEANNRIERFDKNGNFVSAWGKDTIAAVVNERQRIVVEATAGTYTLSFDGSTTAPIAYSADRGPIRQGLAALPSMGGEANFSVNFGVGSATNPFVVTFRGALGGSNQPTITADTSELSGTVSIYTIANGASSTSDTGAGFEICTIANECQAGTASGENGALDHPQSVAVDQDTGNVYVSDRGNRRIDEYDGEGHFIRSFGFDVAESGPGNTGTGYEVCNQGESDVCKVGVGGSGVGQYGEGFAENGFGIAVSPADANASTGTVYLADSGNRRVDTYDLDGTNPSSFGSLATFGFEQPRSVAVDSRGIVYASDSNNNGDVQRYDSEDANGGGVGFLEPIVPPNNEVQEVALTGLNEGDTFRLACPNGSPTGELTYVAGETGQTIIKNGLEEACGASNVSLEGEPPNTMVTFQGALAGANQPQMTCTALSGSGSCSVTTTSEGHPGPLLTGNAFSATAGLAVNPAGTTLYVLRKPSSGSTVVQQFGPTNEPGLGAAPTASDDTHGAAAHFSNSFSVHGFGFDSTSGRLYVSVNNDPDGFQGPLTSAHRVYVIAESSALPNPTASTPFAAAVTAIADRSATFHGTVDPLGGLVGCKFQYSTDEINWTDVNVPNCVALSENGGEQNISQKVSGLVPGTHYFVRLQVTRPYFPDFTPVTSIELRSFTTATGPPVLAGAKARAVDERSVRVTATIDPSHSPTSYAVQYGTTPSSSSSTAPVQIGAGSAPVEVSAVVSGLNPTTQYYFKLVATNLAGSTVSEGLPAATFPSPPSFGSCPNDRFRTGPSAKLPDCRAYEQATPTDKFGSDVFGNTYTVEASSAGDGITFFTLAGFPGSEGFQNQNVFHSRFVGDEWSTAGLNTPPSYGDNAEVLAWTSDLRLSFARTNVSGGPPGANLVMRDSADGSRTLIIPQGVGFGSSSFKLGGAFDDDSKVVFQASGPIPVSSGPAPVSAASNVYLYDRDTGELTLVGLLPDSACGSPPCVPSEGSEVPLGFESYAQEGHAVSPTGDVYFTDAGTGQLYLRRDAAGPGASTVQVSASERTDCADHDPCSGIPEPDPSGTFSAQFLGATPDNSHAFFKSEEELTDDANTAAGSKDLYRFDSAEPVGQRLTDLVPGAGVVGVAGYSDDGSYVYFAGNGDLDGAGPAQAGDCGGSANAGGGHDSFKGSCSLYLWQADGTGDCASAGGCVSFIVGTNREGYPRDDYNWAGGEGGMKASRVSADGRTLVFRSKRQLTAYDNTPTSTKVFCESGCPEFYRYDADSGQVACLTCNPTGAPPAGALDIKNPDLYHANTSHLTYLAQPFLSRNLSPDGNRFFFETPDKLVPGDVNGDQACPYGADPITGTAGDTYTCTDVYEWEAPGKGSCTANSGAYSPANGGCIYLLSTGTGPYPSYLADVSESGDVAFIFSRQQLVPVDEDTQQDLYAVKVNGGLAYQHAVRPAACEGDACRGAASQPSDAPGAGTAVFEGPGNPKQNTNSTRCPKGKRTVHSKGKVRCVAKQHGHKKQKRHHKRAANNERRASR